MSVDIRVVDEPAREAGRLLAEAAVPGAQIALSGGGTVGRAYEVAARAQPLWRNVHVWFGDDRAVPPSDKRSNYLLVRERLVDALGSPPEVHRIRGEKGADEAAALYHAELEGVTWDLALNGIGPDGHTASLFPASPGLAETERRALAAEPGFEPYVARVTATPPVFAAAAVLIYLVSGEDKADAVRRAFAEEPSPETPSSLIRGRETIALLDPAAAARLG